MADRLRAWLVPSGPVWLQVLTVAALVALALVVGWTLVGPLANGDAVTNMHAVQADAFLHGHLDLGHPKYPDASFYRGEAFSPYPPMPAVVLMPLVLVLGLHGPTPAIVAMLAMVVSAVLAIRICRRVGLAPRLCVLLTLGLLFGTALWSCVIGSGGVWFFAHVIATMFLLAAFDAALRGRSVLTGCFLGAAFLSRQFTICAAPFLLMLLIDERDDGADRRGRVVRFAVPLGVLVAAYLAYNAARFTGPFDTGYSYIKLEGFLKARVDAHGIFSLAYVPFNFVYMFLQGFHVNYGGKSFLKPTGVDGYGTSLIVASPFLIYALWARLRRGVLIAAWASIAVCVLGELTYYNNGFLQENAQRFSLDFVPMLFVLVAYALVRRRSGFVTAGIVWAIGLNVIALAVLPQSVGFQ